MLTILRAALAAGRATSAYPGTRVAPPPRFRGRPHFQGEACTGEAACAAVCPAAAIQVSTGPAHPAWSLDTARCVFCGLCEAACPSQAISFTADFEMAARDREALVVRGIPGMPSPPQPAATRLRVGMETRFTALTRRLLRRSLHIRHMDAGSDNGPDWELNALLNPVYDVQRLGIDVVASPRHADLLFVTGAVTRNLAAALQRTYEAMPAPRLVVAAGADACGGGVLQGSYAVAGGVDAHLPVDVYIPGDPPRPEAIIYGLLLAMERREARSGRQASAPAGA